MELIVEGLQRKLDLPIYAGQTTIVANQEFVNDLWKTVISRQIQFRLQIRFIQWRQVLIQAGVHESVLPLTAELKSRLEMEKRTQGSPLQEG